MHNWPFVWVIHQWLVDSPHKGPVMHHAFPCPDVIMKPWWDSFSSLTLPSSQVHTTTVFFLPLRVNKTPYSAPPYWLMSTGSVSIQHKCLPTPVASSSGWSFMALTNRAPSNLYATLLTDNLSTLKFKFTYSSSTEGACWSLIIHRTVILKLSVQVNLLSTDIL